MSLAAGWLAGLSSATTLAGSANDKYDCRSLRSPSDKLMPISNSKWRAIRRAIILWLENEAGITYFTPSSSSPRRWIDIIPRLGIIP